jgi:hypothetical protein
MRSLCYALIGIVALQGCWAQKEVGLRDVPPAVNLFIDLSTNHRIDKAWRKANLDLIFHPNFDGLGLMPRNKAIQEIVPVANHGQALFLSSKLGQVLKARAWVDYTKPNKEPEDVLIVRIDYLVVATMVAGEMMVFEKPVTALEYIVLAFDSNDGKQKVIGEYPSPKDEQFIGARYFLANFEALSGDKNMKGQLKNVIGR